MKGAEYDYSRIMEDENFALQFFEYLSLLSREKFKELKHLSSQCNHLPGNWIEFGVYKGGSFGFLALQLKLLNSSKKIIGIDTFEGHPYDNVYKGETIPRKEYFWDTSFDLVQKIMHRLQLSEFTSLHKGTFEDILFSFSLEFPISFAHIDCDLYQSTKVALLWLLKHLVFGGIVVFDDYGTDQFGVGPAVNELIDPSEIETFGSTKFWRKQ